MLSVILLTIAGWLLEAGIAYSLYRVIERRIPALLYRVLLVGVFWQVLNTLAALTTWFLFKEGFTLLLFYGLLAVLGIPFALWAIVGGRRKPALPVKESLTVNEKVFLINFGVLFLVLFLSTARYGFMPMWGNVDMANQYNAINAFHAKMLPGWQYPIPFVVKAAPALRSATNMWGYVFGYNFLTALISRLTFIETIYLLNVTTCFNMALWLSAPLLLVEWKNTKVWTVLYWVWVAFSVQDWYSAVDRGWLTSIYSLGQCVIVLACVFYMNRLDGKNGLLFYLGIGIGSFMVANAHPYNYPIFFLSVLLMALFSGERNIGKKLLRALLYGSISIISLLPLCMENAFWWEFKRIFGFLFSGDFAGLLTIRNFQMLTTVKAPMWIGIGAMIAGIVVVLLLVRSVKKSYIVGISAVATVVALYAVYGSGGYLYQKEAILTPPLFFMLGLHLIHDLWQLVYQKWLKGRLRMGSEAVQSYVVAPLLIVALLAAGQIDFATGITHIQERFIDSKPMIEPAYYRASKIVADRLSAQGGKGLVNFRTLDGARKMFLARIVREDDLAQSIPDLDYYAVEATTFEKIIQYIDMTPDDKRPAWEEGWYLVHDGQEKNWPGYDILSLLMTEEEQVYSEDGIAVTRMQLRPDVRSVYYPLAGGVPPVRIRRTNANMRYMEDFGYGTMASTVDTPAVLGMDNLLVDTSGDLLFLLQGKCGAPGRVTLRILDADGNEVAHSILPAFDGLAAVTIPEDALAQGAARFELVLTPGNIPASAVLQWMRVYAIPGGEE